MVNVSVIASGREPFLGREIGPPGRDWLHQGHNRFASFNALTVIRKVLEHDSKDLW